MSRSTHRFIPACHRFFITLALGAAVLPAQAIFKCTHAGTVEYTDRECAGARTVVPADLRQTDILKADRADAEQRAAAEKAELSRLEKARHANEQQAEKLRQRRVSAMQLRHRRCQALQMRKKWLEEDRRETRKWSYRIGNKKSKRLAEKYAMECGG